jgi:uncharacterized membrane protein SpoIIM required for sporulation
VDAVDGADFIRLYRQLCHDLAVAQQRQYSPYLIDRLNRLVMAGHQRLYQRKSRFFEETLRFIVEGLPLSVRENGRLMLLAALCFFGPALLFGVTVYVFPSLVYSVFNLDQIRGFTEMYDPKSHAAMQDARNASDDLMMFGFYIKNNIGIAFQTFAGGILFGVGTLFFLTYNGIVIGGVAGHLTEIGHIDSFYSFVITHGAFELTAIVMAGAAGFGLGRALLIPGDLTRLAALRRSARNAMPLVYGIILFLFIAAFIEAFWSSSAWVPSWLKYAVGSTLWTLVLCYFLFAGRKNGSR